MSHPVLTETSTLRLRRFFVKGKGDQYTAINRDGGQAISTSGVGVEAIRLLARGKTLAHTKRVLGRRYGHSPDEIDLAPLIDTLFSSGFVRALDGREVPSPEAPARHGLRLWLTIFVLSPLLAWAFRHLPPRLALSLAYRWFAAGPRPEVDRRIAANLLRAPGLGVSPSEVPRIVAAHRHAVRKQFCDRLLLGSLPPDRLRRWLGEDVRVSGLQHLARQDAKGPGAILCSFHIGAYGLIPFVLGARGVAVTVYVGFGDDAQADLARWLTDQARGGSGYAVYVVDGRMGLRTLARRLEQGETVLMYCDRAPGAAQGSPERQGLIGVPFLGTRIWSARGVGWLHARTGAPVLPAVLLWEGRAGHHLHIRPDVCPSPTSQPKDADAVVVAAYSALERYARRDPAQWLKWEDFGDMLAPRSRTLQDDEDGPGSLRRRP